MNKKERTLRILEFFNAQQSEITTELNFCSVFQLLCAVVLSAQCTDKRVNTVTPQLFNRFPTPEAMADASPEEIRHIIASISYPNTKAEKLAALARKIVTEHNGVVPDTFEQLTALPGVGRKTANLLLGDLYGVPGSVVCDTHCIRICGRLGLSHGKEPEKVEKQLRAILPPEESSDFCHRIVLFGRDCCTSQRPKCGECPLTMYCKEFNP